MQVVSIPQSSVHASGCQQSRLPEQSISASQHATTRASQCSIRNIQTITSLKELADECHRQGIGLHFYYSHIDWGREDAPLGRTGLGTGRPKEAQNWDSYYQFMNNQLTELLSNYGEVNAIWFDGWWDQDINPSFDWRLPEQYALIHKLQPSCLIGNNHHSQPFDGEDFQNYKSTKTLIHYLVNAAGRNANLLMNIGPQPDGCLPEVAVQRLKEMGEWMKVYGETIYGTRGGLVAPHDWGVTTQKDNRLFVHILNLQDRSLFLPIGSKKIRKAVDFATRKAVKTQKCDGGVLISLDEVPTDVDKVIEIQL